ncbi:LLM class flavin-dependent oxidoreductase [Gordonia sp. NPDC003376]
MSATVPLSGDPLSGDPLSGDPVILRLTGSGDLAAAIDVARDVDHHQTGTVVVDTVDADDLDPFVVAAAIAAATDFIRIAVAVPVAQWHPYPVARRLAEIDKLSAGRLLWGAVDSDPGRVAEAVDVVSALLTSWGPAALVNDRASGRHADLAQITPVIVSGRHFGIDSPLDVPAGPQGVVPVVEIRTRSREDAR